MHAGGVVQTGKCSLNKIDPFRRYPPNVVRHQLQAEDFTIRGEDARINETPVVPSNPPTRWPVSVE